MQFTNILFAEKFYCEFQTFLPKIKYLLLNKDVFDLSKNVWLKLPKDNITYFPRF